MEYYLNVLICKPRPMLPFHAKTEQTPRRHIALKLILLTWQCLCKVSHGVHVYFGQFMFYVFGCKEDFFVYLSYNMAVICKARHHMRKREYVTQPLCARFGKRNRYVQTLMQNIPLWWKQNTSFLYFAIAIFLKCRCYFTICLKVSSGMFLSVSTGGLLIVL